MKAIRILPCSIIAALAAVPLQSLAFDLSPDTTQILTDPTYFPSRGQFTGSTGYSYDTSRADVKNASGAKAYSFRNNADAFAQSFGYGITDNLRIGVDATYDIAHRTDDFVSGASTKTKSTGFTDPVFSVGYRAINQKMFPVSLDFDASYSPDLVDAKAATPANSGTVGRGGQAMTLGVAVGREMKDFTLQGVTGATRFGQTTIENATTGLTGKTDAYWAPYVGINTQTRLTDRVSINGDVRYTRKQDTTGTGANGTAFEASHANTTALDLALNYHIVPNRLVAQLTYGHDFYTDATRVTSATQSSTTTDHHSDAVGARLEYVF